MGGYRMGLVRFIEIFEGCKGFTRVSSGFYIYGVGAFYGVFLGCKDFLGVWGGFVGFHTDCTSCFKATGYHRDRND